MELYQWRRCCDNVGRREGDVKGEMRLEKEDGKMGPPAKLRFMAVRVHADVHTLVGGYVQHKTTHETASLVERLTVQSV